MKLLILAFLCWVPVAAICLALWHAFVTAGRNNDNDP